MKPRNESSNIKDVTYDQANRVMTIEFAGGAKHEYHGVTAEDHQALLDAESPGKHFHKHIRNGYVTKKIG